MVVFLRHIRGDLWLKTDVNSTVRPSSKRRLFPFHRDTKDLRVKNQLSFDKALGLKLHAPGMMRGCDPDVPNPLPGPHSTPKAAIVHTGKRDEMVFGKEFEVAAVKGAYLRSSLAHDDTWH